MPHLLATLTLRCLIETLEPQGDSAELRAADGLDYVTDFFEIIIIYNT